MQIDAEMELAWFACSTLSVVVGYFKGTLKAVSSSRLTSSGDTRSSERTFILRIHETSSVYKLYAYPVVVNLVRYVE